MKKKKVKNKYCQSVHPFFPSASKYAYTYGKTYLPCDY